MRVLLFIIIILTQINLYSQSKDKFNVSGFVKDDDSKLSLPDCKITMITPTGVLYRSETDSNGYFKIENVSIFDSIFILLFKRDKFFHEELKIYFNNNPHDTIVSVLLRTLEVNVEWFPEIYFKYNKSKPIKNYKKALVELVKTLNDNPRIIIKIIGYNDSQETIDLRIERVNFILKKLIDYGIDKERLKTEISNNPNFIKENTMKLDFKNKTYKKLFLTNDFISKNPSLQEREKFRQLNRCVNFEIIGDDYIK